MCGADTARPAVHPQRHPPLGRQSSAGDQAVSGVGLVDHALGAQGEVLGLGSGPDTLPFTAPLASPDTLGKSAPRGDLAGRPRGRDRRIMLQGNLVACPTTQSSKIRVLVPRVIMTKPISEKPDHRVWSFYVSGRPPGRRATHGRADVGGDGR